MNKHTSGVYIKSNGTSFRYKQHETDFDVIPTKRPLSLPCKVRGCRCSAYLYVPQNGSKAVRCRCKHLPEDHSEATGHFCKKCECEIHKLCLCSLHYPYLIPAEYRFIKTVEKQDLHSATFFFRCLFWVREPLHVRVWPAQLYAPDPGKQTCIHDISSHHTLNLTVTQCSNVFPFPWQVETKQERESRGQPVGRDVSYAAMGGLTGFGSLLDGYLALGTNESGELAESPSIKKTGGDSIYVCKQ